MEDKAKSLFILFAIGPDQQTIIRRLKKLPEEADDVDVCLALEEIIDELSAGQSE